jgi:hypothetical protein
MTNRKLSETATVLAIAALALTILAPGAFAQTRDYRFQIPFDFYAGGQLMPAGNYTITQHASSRATQIHDGNGNITTVLPLATINRVIGNNRLVFNRYGSLHFLTEMQWAGSNTGLKVRETQLERDARLGNVPVKVAVQPEK